MELENIREIVNHHGTLPEPALRFVAEATERPLVDIDSVVTFYKSFSLEPRGTHLVSICTGTACHVRGASLIGKEFKRQLGVDPGQTTSDGKFTLETVNCLGACAFGPVAVVDGHYFSKVQKSGVNGVLEKAEKAIDDAELSADERVFPVQVSCPRCNRSLMDRDNLVLGAVGSGHSVIW